LDKNFAAALDKFAWQCYTVIAKKTWQRSDLMDREEILAKSRKENEGIDEFEKEVLKEGRSAGAAAAAVAAFLLFIVQICLDKGQNYGLYAVLVTMVSAQFIVKAVKLKRKHEIALAVFYTLFALMLAAAHIWQLVIG